MPTSREFLLRPQSEFQQHDAEILADKLPWSTPDHRVRNADYEFIFNRSSMPASENLANWTLRRLRAWREGWPGYFSRPRIFMGDLGEIGNFAKTCRSAAHFVPGYRFQARVLDVNFGVGYGVDARVRPLGHQNKSWDTHFRSPEASPTPASAAVADPSTRCRTPQRDRSNRGEPALSATPAPPSERPTSIGTFYLLVLATTITGWLFASFRGWSISLFYLVPLPMLASKSEANVKAFDGWHQAMDGRCWC